MIIMRMKLVLASMAMVIMIAKNEMKRLIMMPAIRLYIMTIIKVVILVILLMKLIMNVTLLLIMQGTDKIVLMKIYDDHNCNKHIH